MGQGQRASEPRLCTSRDIYTTSAWRKQAVMMADPLQKHSHTQWLQLPSPLAIARSSVDMNFDRFSPAMMLIFMFQGLHRIRTILHAE